MIGRFERRNNLKPRVFARQRGNPLPHPPSSAVNRKFHPRCWMFDAGCWMTSNIQHLASNIDSLSALTILAIQINRPNNLIEVVLDLHGPIRKRGPVYAAAAEHPVELGLICRVISHRGRRVFELMPGE